MADLTYDTQEAVPEDIRESAVAKDGKFVVSVVPKSKLDEFRTNNLKVVGERDGLTGVIARLQTDVGLKTEKPEDLDGFITNYKELQATAQQVADGKLVKDTSLDEALNKRTGEMKTQHAAQVAQLSLIRDNALAQVDLLQRQLDETRIDQLVTNAAADETSGLRGDALRAVLKEGREFFKMVDGKLIAKDEDGATIYGADGVTPMKPLEWIKIRLSAEAPYLFKVSEGGGAGGSRNFGGMSPEALGKLDPQERMRLSRTQGR